MISVKYSKVNQCWLGLWNDQLIRLFVCEAEANEWLGKMNNEKECYYCGGNCPNEPDDSEYLCDGFAGDIDGLYAEQDLAGGAR